MAQKVNRIVELQMKLEGAQTVEELRNTTREINQELAAMDKNSDAFADMEKLARDANSEVREIRDNLKGVTSTEQVQAVKAMGDGLVGAFTAASGAAVLFGNKSEEEIKKIIIQIGSLMAMVDGLSKVFLMFDNRTARVFKDVVKGFKQSSIAAKLFGTTTRAAITATGIGLIVIAIAAIIANFEKLREAARNNFEQIKKAIMFIAPPLYLIIRVVEEIRERFGDLRTFVVGVTGAIRKFLQTLSFKKAREEFDTIVEREKEVNRLREEYNRRIVETEDAHRREIALLQEMGDKQEEILELEKERFEETVRLLEARQDLKKLSDEEIEALEEARFQLEIIEIRQRKINERKQEEARIERERAAEAARRAKEEAEREAERLQRERERAEEEARRAEEAARQEQITVANLLIQNELAEKNLELKRLIIRAEDDIVKNRLQIEQLDNEIAAEGQKLRLLREQYDALTDAEKASSDGLKLRQDIIKAEENIEKSIERQIGLEDNINKILEERNQIQEEIDDGLEQWQRKLQEILGTYGQLIEASRDLLWNTISLAIQAADAEAKAEIEKINEIKEAEMKAMQEQMDFEKEMHKENVEFQRDLQRGLEKSLNDLRDESLSAEGSRYAEIQAMIAEQQAAQQAAAMEEMRLEEEKLATEARLLAEKEAMEAEYEAQKQAAEKKSAKLRKQQAIIDATIGMALSIINALATSKPFLPMGAIMAGVAAALGATQIALIAKQPTFESGGYTGDGDKYQPAGIVHKGEYVVPKHIVSSPEAAMLLQALEGMRQNGYATGGGVNIPDIPTADEMLDYERIGDEVARAMHENPMFVSWVEWREMTNKMTFIQSRASINRQK